MSPLDLLVARGDGSADLVRTDIATYRDVFDHAVQAGFGCDYLIASGQLLATGIRIERSELFDAAHWLSTGEHKSVGFVHVIEVTREVAR